MKKIRRLIELRREFLLEDFDSVDILDGREGSGKSTLGLHMLDYYYQLKDGKVTPEHIKHMCLEREDFLKDLKDMQKYEMTDYDEAGDLSSRESMSKFNRMMKKTFQVVRGDNLWVLMTLPRIFDMEVYFRGHRLSGLLHCFRRGYVAYYDREKVNKLLDINLKLPFKNYSLVKPLWVDSYPKYTGVLLKPYLDMKARKMKKIRNELYEKLQVEKLNKKSKPKLRIGHCNKCDYEWQPRNPNPSQCPACRGRDLKIEVRSPVAVA